jgi:AcrR family transcriptional regulator
MAERKAASGAATTTATDHGSEARVTRRRRAPSDGRHTRSDHTRQLIATATIELIESGETRPTVAQIAGRAGVATRTLYNSFDDVDAVFRYAAVTQVARHQRLIGIIPPHGPTSTRIQLICHQRRQYFEAIAPVLRAAYLRTDDTAELHRQLADHRALLRRQLVVGFRTEISARGPHAPVLLRSIELVTGWQNWNSLRVDDGRTASAAEQVMAYSVSGLLG